MPDENLLTMECVIPEAHTPGQKLVWVSPLQWIDHNMHFFSRIFPKGLRVNSSNYMPLNTWMVGAQMVALNYQTNDMALQINHGLFRLNSGCGYVLKPDWQRDPGEAYGKVIAQAKPDKAIRRKTRHLHRHITAHG